ncbi:hypothetical protein F2Q69_00009552 [Brassica cretica]|uniref:Uncharacterized protein n=1 Tax=Brassica cretica TaxID=69181 RepID=A0A8S9PAY7_BRACR|nr:hypothetical protein F2Q69_00009552 [Brassica cretica]
MWTQDAELAWNKLDEHVYTVEKKDKRKTWRRNCENPLGVFLGRAGEVAEKTTMLKDGQYGHWKVRMKLLVRGINDVAWIAMKTRWVELTIFTSDEKMPKPNEPRQGVVREVVQEVVRRMRGEVVTFWSKECISRWGEKHGDGRPDIDGAYLVGKKKTMWTHDAELAWDKLEEQVYAMEKRQEINLESKFMP